MHPTSDKGDIGVAMVTADLIKRGVDVLVPLSSTAPFDLGVLHNNKFLKVQVKYRAVGKSGAICIQRTRAVVTNSKISRREMLVDEVDLYAVYCPDTDECYYLDHTDITDCVDIQLRVRPPKNNQTVGIRMAANFKEPKFLQ